MNPASRSIILQGQLTDWPKIYTTILGGFSQTVRIYFYCTLVGAELYCGELNLAISSSPVKNNNVQFFIRRTATVWNIKKFIAVRRV